MPEWTGIVETTIHKYVREEEVNILRNRKLLAMLQSRGRFSFGNSGDLVNWKVRFKRGSMSGYADMDTLTFQRVNRRKSAELDWRGYAIAESYSKKEKLMNKGTEAIIKYWSNKGQEMMEDVEDAFGEELYVDGNASSNTRRMHGVESFFGNSGAASGGYIGTPSDTYAGLSTSLGNYGGSWTGTWPTGTGDAHYDFWSPLIVDYTDTAWTPTTKTWPNTCQQALRYGIVKGRRNKSKKNMLDMILLENELFRQFEDSYSAAERLNIARGDKKDGLYALGFQDTINFDGVDISSEYGIASGLGYGFTMGDMEVMSLQDKLFVPEGPTFDQASLSWRLSIDFFGNARMNPRGMLKFINIT